jgi:uncharacterized OB-fold protein
MSARLAPTTTPDTEGFWNGVRDHKLLIQRCAGCQALRHPPRPMCPRCNALAWDTIESSGRGEVYSFVMPRHPPFPWFEGTYVVALVALEEGIRLVSNLCEIDPGDVRRRTARAPLGPGRDRAAAVGQLAGRLTDFLSYPRALTQLDETSANFGFTRLL